MTGAPFRFLGGINMSLATRLNQLRLKRGKSLQEVADAMDVSKTHIWELEKGRSENPSLDMLKKLSDYFEVSIRTLVGEDMDASEDDGLVKMFRQASQLGPRDREILESMIKSMTKGKDEIG
jgi:transcriptional regulator with XRE-family HTH domain